MPALGPEARCAQLPWQGWRELPASQQRFFGGQLLLLTAVRLFLSWTLVWHDDATSYALFVRHGLLAVGAYYPLPNNHELSNLISLAFYQLHQGFWWSMRLPVLLTSTAGTLLLFRVLLRRLGYWPALLVAGATSWLGPSLYYAANGRGYWLVLLLTGLLFWALLALLDSPGPTARERVAWLVLVGAGVLGSYAVPTFAYVLVSAWSWLSWQAIGRRQWGLLKRTATPGLVVLAGVVACYGPTLYVSGWQSLLDNPFLRPRAAPRLPPSGWQQLPAYLWQTENYLGGQFHLGALVGLAGLVAFGWVARQAQAGRLPAAARRQVQQVGWPALWFMLGIYLLLPAQRVWPPERAWLYKSWFSFMLLAVGLAEWPWRRAWRWALGAGAVVVVLYQVKAVLGDNRTAWLAITKHRTEYQWFASHFDVLYPAARVAPAPPPNSKARP